MESTRVKRPDGTIWNKPNPSPVKILATILILVAGLRYWIGADFPAYYEWEPVPWPDVFRAIVGYHEGGFALLVKLSRSLDNNGQHLILSCSFITIGLYCLTIYKHSASFQFSILLYLLMGDWQGSFNAIRQYLGAAVLFSGHRYILERDYRKYFLIVLIAASFHKTALVMILPYFLLTRKPSHGQLALLAVGALVLRFSYGFLFDVVSEIKGQEVDMLADEYYTHNVNIFRVLVACVPILVYLLQCSKTGHTKEQEFYVNIVFFHAFCMIAAMGSAYLARIGAYTNAAVPIAYGALFQLIPKQTNRNGVKSLAVILYFLYWIYSVRALDGGEFHFNLDIF